MAWEFIPYTIYFILYTYMNYIFFGSPRFAAIILESLIKAGMPPITLVCNPDRPVGRKKVVTAPETKQVATSYQLSAKSSIEILQPEKLDSAFLEKLRRYNADFYVVAAYAKILKRELLDIPRLGVMGVHPSLLPKYRGASPIQSAILNQDVETGVDLFMIDEKVDHGGILASQKVKVKSQNYLELEKELAEAGASVLIETLPKFAKNEITPTPQDETLATYTRKFETEDGFVEYEAVQKAQDGDLNLAKEIDAKIRALSQEPGVYTIKDGKRIKLLKSAVDQSHLKLTHIQFEGKKPIENKNRLF